MMPGSKADVLRTEIVDKQVLFLAGRKKKVGKWTVGARAEREGFSDAGRFRPV